MDIFRFTALRLRGRLVLCGAALLAGLCSAGAAQQLRLDPADEGAQDASWTEFRTRLLQALASRDRNFVTAILHPSVRSGLEGDRGTAEFRRNWAIDADTSPFWRELTVVLGLGSAWHRQENEPAELCAPYVAVKWPQDVDAFRGGAVVVPDARMKSAPSAGAATLATLSYDLVEVQDWEVSDQAAGVPQKWVKLRYNQSDGYLPEEHVRSPIEHAACFVRVEGQWRLTGFGPGSGR